MKQFLGALICLFVFHGLVLSQETESQELTKKAMLAYQQRDLEGAISFAQQVINVETNRRRIDWPNMATAEMNLALFKKEHYWNLRRESRGLDFGSDQFARSAATRIAYRKSVPEHFQKVIDISEKQLADFSLRLAISKIELASFLNYYDTSTGFQLEQDLIDLYLDRKESLKRQNRIEKLYSEGFQLQKKLLGENDDSTLSTMLVIAKFYLSNAEYEQAWRFFEDYIGLVEKKYGSKSQFLVTALNAMAALSKAAEMESEKADYLKRLEVVSGKNEVVGTFGFDLTPRCTSDELKLLLNSPDTATIGTKKQKWLLVNVRLDEKGNVVDAKSESIDEKDMFGKDLATTAEKQVRNWKFKPLQLRGQVRKVAGTVWFPYLIKS